MDETSEFGAANDLITASTDNDLNPFVFLEMLRAQDMPSKEFVYLNMVASDKYNPYDLEIVPYR